MGVIKKVIKGILLIGKHKDKIEEFITKRDFFGTQPSIIFRNKKKVEYVHKTAFGGLLSILVIITMVGIIYMKAAELFKNEGVIA